MRRGGAGNGWPAIVRDENQLATESLYFACDGRRARRRPVRFLPVAGARRRRGGRRLEPRAKNVILMISDGCGFNQVEAASLFRYGRPDATPLSAFPVASR